MNGESSPDLVAAASVSRRVEVETIRLTRVELTPENLDGIGDVLQLKGSEHVIGNAILDGKVEVNCTYEFTFESVNDDVRFTLLLAYGVIYELQGEMPSEYDLHHFADANGRYHTWPFAREMVVSLTAKMGYVPFVLPALSFSPKASLSQDEPDEQIEDTPTGGDEPVE